jgi:predicted amidohydrolase
MKVAACQLPDVRNDVPQALSLIKKYTADAQRSGANLICFPECFLQGYDLRAENVAEVAIDLNSGEFAHLLRELERLDPVIVIGLIEWDAGAFYNTAVAIERRQLLARYRKIHLLTREQSIFEHGNDSPIFDIAGTKVGINICHDLNVAESVASAAAAGAELLVCPCNNMLPRKTAEEWKLRHHDIRSRRAREQSLWLVSSDVTGERDDGVSYGPTAVIDPNGAVIEQVPLMETGMIVAEIR